MSVSNNRRIAKNTLMLYFRMIFTMVVALYTSRIVLKTLGIDDFGVYNVVGGIVALFSFLSGALSNSTSRFLAYELGKNDFNKQKRVFSTTLSINILLAILIGILAETIGLWYVKHKLVVDPERLQAAIWTFHFSVLSIMISVTQIPYNASIIAHERMNVYAYLSILEVSLKLLIVYLLVTIHFDKLVVYAILMFGVQGIIALVYRIYSIRSFKECKYTFVWDKGMMKSILSFSGWSLTGNFSYMLINQGTNILLNFFFGPGVNAAKAISVQVNNVISSFVTNIRTAANPQIVKLHAENKQEEMKNLVMNTAKFSFYLLLILILPVLLETKIILKLWLVEYPDYAVIFIQLVLLDTLVNIFSVSFHSVLLAINRLKETSMVAIVLSLMILIVGVFIFKMGYNPEYVFYFMLIKSFLQSFVIKPILLSKYSNYRHINFVNVFGRSFLVVIIGSIPPILFRLNYDEGITRLFIGAILSSLSIGFTVYFLGIDKPLRQKINHLVMDKINFRNKYGGK